MSKLNNAAGGSDFSIALLQFLSVTLFGSLVPVFYCHVLLMMLLLIVVSAATLGRRTRVAVLTWGHGDGTTWMEHEDVSVHIGVLRWDHPHGSIWMGAPGQDNLDGSI